MSEQIEGWTTQEEKWAAHPIFVVVLPGVIFGQIGLKGRRFL